jgi:hypothetical protein
MTQFGYTTAIISGCVSASGVRNGRILTRRRALTLGADPETAVSSLLVEADLNINAADYRSAVISAVAADLTTVRTSVRRQAVKTICMYQMGDRAGAIALRNDIEHGVARSTDASRCIKRRFTSAVDVLEFMPQLFTMLKHME